MNMMKMMSNMKEKEFQSLIKEATTEVMKGEKYSLKTDESRLVVAIGSGSMGAMVFGSYKADFGETPGQIAGAVAEITAMAKDILDDLTSGFQADMEKALIANAIEGALCLDNDEEEDDYDDYDDDEYDDDDDDYDDDDYYDDDDDCEWDEYNSVCNFEEFKKLLAEGYRETCPCSKCTVIREYLKKHPEITLSKM